MTIYRNPAWGEIKRLTAAVILGLLYIGFPAGCGSETAVPAPPAADADAVARHIAILAAEDDARIAGTPREREAGSYIAETMRTAGLEVEFQTFPITAFRSGPASLATTAGGLESITARPFIYSSPSGEAGLSAVLVDGGLGRPSDFAGRDDIAGSIVLIRRGEIYFSEKAVFAAGAGAAAAVIYNNESGSIVGTLMEPPGIPVVGISGEAGEVLADMLKEGAVITATVNSDTEVRQGESLNVIGRFPDVPEDAPIVLIGAHLDSVDTPGGNDNASGLAAMLESAGRLAGSRRIDKTEAVDYRFVAFGAEEIGLVGSAQYVAELTPDEMERFAGAVILDSLGHGTLLEISRADGNPGTMELTDKALDFARAAGLPAAATVMPGSDHASFARAGLPAVLLSSTPYKGIHTDADTAESVDAERTAAIASIAAALAAAAAE